MNDLLYPPKMELRTIFKDKEMAIETSGLNQRSLWANSLK